LNIARIKNIIISRLIKPTLSFLLPSLSYLVPKQKNLILFGSYLGKHFGDNGGFLYEYCLKYHGDEFRYVWLTDNGDVISHVRGLGGEACLKSSLKGLWYSVRAVLIVTSYGIRDVLLYEPYRGFPKELYLSHGAAFRKTLMVEEGGMRCDSSMTRNRGTMDYLTVISQWNAEYEKSSFGLFSSQIRVTGYPRNDIFCGNYDTIIQRIIKKYGLALYNILYVPTWRKHEPTNFFPFPDCDIEKIAGFLKEKNMNIILRPHMVDMRRQKRNEQFWLNIKKYRDVMKIITIDVYTDIQLLMCLADCLITDYSSIQLDYLLLSRPMIFMPYDIEYFNRVGGFHCDYDEFTPGPKPRTQKEFLECLEMFHKGEDPFFEKRLQIRDTVHDYKDGQSCRRVYELIKEISDSV
tara:strand:- start:258 stop:1475 length:1218 start_codon:yes stop_codon:yes gene_type:complete